MRSILERLRSSRAALEHRLAPPAPPRPPRWPPRANAPDTKAPTDKRTTLTTIYRDKLFMPYLLPVTPHPRLSDACSSPPIASRVISSVSSSTNGSSIVILNGSCANSSRFLTKTLHCPISQMAAHRAARFCVFGGRNRRTRSTAVVRLRDRIRRHEFAKDLGGMRALPGEHADVAAH